MTGTVLSLKTVAVNHTSSHVSDPGNILLGIPGEAMGSPDATATSFTMRALGYKRTCIIFFFYSFSESKHTFSFTHKVHLNLFHIYTVRHPNEYIIETFTRGRWQMPKVGRLYSCYHYACTEVQRIMGLSINDLKTSELRYLNYLNPIPVKT